MNTVTKALLDLETALQTVSGIAEVRMDPGTLTAWPTLVIGPPQIEREGPDTEPTGATFAVYAVVENGDRATERLCLLEPEVAAAIDKLTRGVVRGPSVPFPYPQGQTDLPSYQLIVEVGLS